jgi:hypothetical protein
VAGSFLGGSISFAQDQATYSADARPVRIEGATNAEAPLRWKAKPIAGHSGATKVATGFSPINTGVVQASHTSDSTKSPSAGGWNKIRIDTYVTPAQATAPVDPFADPFGDRHATRAAATLVLQPPNTPNPNTPGTNPNLPRYNPAIPNPARPEAIPAPMNPLPAFPPASPPTTPSPFPAPGVEPPPVNPAFPPAPMTPAPTPMPTPPSTDPAPMPPSNAAPMPEGSDSSSRLNPNPTPSNEIPCPDRTYNDLNCCKADITCRNFINSLMKDKLSDFAPDFLDITPRFNPNKSPKEDALERTDKMSRTGVRKWYRRGVTYEQQSSSQALIVGTLENLTNGRAVIRDEEGVSRNIPLNDLSEDDLCFISGHWNLPPECAIVSNKRVDLYNRGWTPSTMSWTASALCHKPLYFEQVQHERYGHTAGPFKQPWIDGAHFFGSAIMLPYQMALDPPWECEYTLGYYRPGSCAPWHIPPFPFSPRAALTQAGVVVGGIYIIP